MADPNLVDRLTAIATDAELFDAVIALAQAHGIEVTAAELQAQANTNRRIWLERWIAL